MTVATAVTVTCAACGVTLDSVLRLYVVQGAPWCGPCYWRAYP